MPHNPAYNKGVDTPGYFYSLLLFSKSKNHNAILNTYTSPQCTYLHYDTANNGVEYPLGGQEVKPLDLPRHASGFQNAYLGRAPSNPKWKAYVN